MDRWLGSGVLTGLGLLALWLTDSRDRRRRAAGGVVGLVDQLAWVLYALATAQYPFLLSVPAYALVYVRVLRGARPGGVTPAAQQQGVYQEGTTSSPSKYLTDRVQAG